MLKRQAARTSGGPCFRFPTARSLVHRKAGGARDRPSWRGDRDRGRVAALVDTVAVTCLSEFTLTPVASTAPKVTLGSLLESDPDDFDRCSHGVARRREARNLRRHAESHVAFQHAGGRRHFDRTRFRADGHGSRDFRT